MAKVFVTKNGNLLVNGAANIIHNDDETLGLSHYFCTPDFQFIRAVTLQEARHLEKLCLPVMLYPLDSRKLISSPPLWHFMFHIEDVDDSDYEPGLSSNGGKYTFRTRHFFYTRLNGGKVEFLRLSKSSHCCDFEEDDYGNFCNPVSRVEFIDVESHDPAATCFYDQTDRETASIQQYGQIVAWEELCAPSTWTDGEETTDDYNEGDRNELIWKTAPYFLKRRLVEIKRRTDAETIGPFTISRILGEKRGSRRV